MSPTFPTHPPLLPPPQLRLLLQDTLCSCEELPYRGPEREVVLIQQTRGASDGPALGGPVPNAVGRAALPRRPHHILHKAREIPADTCR